MKYFIPEWDDRVDPEYDFVQDRHSERHNKDPYSDFYMWEIFGLKNIPFDGVLVSRVKIEENKIKKQKIQEVGIHNFLRLPNNFQILGDCGAFGYINEHTPRYDPVEILDYYKDLGFNIGVTVDHLVVPKHADEKDFRMKITFENGLKGYQAWKERYKNDFQLLCAVQGWTVKDYLDMLKGYMKHGIMSFAIGGLARKPTLFITELISNMIMQIKDSNMIPNQMHFFGLARKSLFPYFQHLEELGIEVTFDSASFLRRAWLSAQNNYMTLSGNGYSAIRIPQIGGKSGLRGKKKLSGNVDLTQSKILEQECLQKLRSFDKGETDVLSVLDSLEKYDKAIGQNRFPFLKEHYLETLNSSPWKKCDCPICRSIGVEVIIFRGNNRNRRRGFHNIWIFYKIFKNPEYWIEKVKIIDQLPSINLTSLKRGEKVLVITSCTKEKLGYDSKVKTAAKNMYQGLLFRSVKEYCKAMEFDYVIISAKYGLLFPDEEIEGYEKVLKTKKDIETIRPIVEGKLRSVLNNYDKIIVIAGSNYLKTLRGVIDKRFFVVKGKGYGDICSKVRKAVTELTSKKIPEFVYA